MTPGDVIGSLQAAWRRVNQEWGLLRLDFDGYANPTLLGSGTPNGSTFLAGNKTWVAAPSGTVSDGDYGDIVVAGGVWTIESNAVTNAQLADMPEARIKGRAIGAGTGDPMDLTGTQATAILDIFTSTLKGLVPLSGGGTTNFLRADGVWAAPPGGGGGGVPGGSDTHVQFNDSGAFGGDAGLTYNKTTDVLSLAGQLLGAAGSVTAPSYSFTGDSNTGIYSYAADAVGFTTGGAMRAVIGAGALISTVQLQAPNGTAAAPAYSFLLDSDTGMLSGGANVLAFATGSTTRMDIDNVSLDVTVPVRASAGTAAAPSHSFTGETDCGIYSGGTDRIDFATSGVRRGGFDASGNFEIANTGGTGHVLKQTIVGGDVTSGTITTSDIGNSVVTFAKLQNISSPRFLGRITAGTGVIEELTGTQATTLLDVFTSALKGLVPLSGGGTTNFLRADGTWAVPPGGGGGGTPGGADTQVQFNDAGAFGGDAGLTYDKTTDALSIAGQVLGAAGSAATPSHSFTGDPNTGIYSAAPDLIGFSAGGSARFFVSTVAISAAVPLLTQGGSAAATTHSFTGDTDTGMYSPGANTLAFATNGVLRFEVSNSGVAIANTGGTDHFLRQLTAGGPVTSSVLSWADIPDAANLPPGTVLGRGSATTGVAQNLTVGAPLTIGEFFLDFDETAALGNNARVAVSKNGGATVGTRRRINLIEGANVTLTVADDGANEEVDVTIAAAGGSGGTPGGSNTQVQFNDSSAFGGDAGLTYNKTTDALSIAGQVLGGAGSVGSPSYSFTGDPNTGIYSYGTDTIGFATNGTFRAAISAVAYFATIPMQVSNGTAAAPAFSFFLDSDTGIYCGSTNTIDFSTAGVRRGGFDATGNLELVNTGGTGHVLKQATAGGDVTSAQVATADIANSAITFAKIQNIATARILGRVTAGTGVVEELTGTQATTLLDVFTSALKGLVPLSGGGTTNYLRADGVWSAPPGGGGGGVPGGSNTHVQFNDSGAFGGDAGLVFNKTTDILTVGAEIAVPLITLGNTGLHLLDTDASHDLIFIPGSNLTADRTLTIVTGDVNRILTFTGDASISGTNTGDQTITLTGDVTGSGTGSFATTIAANAVTFAKMQDIATARILGRITVGTGDPEALTGTQATTLLDVFTSALKGLVPLSGGGTANFLRADGAWAVPPGGGGGGTPGGSNTHVQFNDSGVFGGDAGLTFNKTTDILTVGAEIAVPLITLGNTGLHLLDIDASHDLVVVPGSDLTLDRTLTIVTGDVDRILTFTADASIGGVNTGDQTITLTGDVTGSGTGSFAATISNDAVTFAKFQNINTDRLVGRDTVGSGDPEEISVTGGIEFNGSSRIQTSAFTGDVTKAAGGTILTLAADVVTFAKLQNINTDRLLGRDTAGIGDPEELTVSGGIEFTGIGGIRTSAFTGDVTKAAGGTVTTISADAVTNAKLANMPASTLKGNNTGISDNPLDLTTTAVTAMLNLFTSTLKGLVPLSGGGTANFLRADGAWAVPPGGGGGGTPGGANTNVQFNDSGAFGGDAGLVFDKTTDILTVGAEIVVPLITLGNTGLHILDIDASHDLIVMPGSNLTADRVLTIVTGDVNRVLTFTGDASISGVNTGDQTITLTGDVAGSGTGSFATTIANNAVTFAKMQDIATATILGRITAGTGDPEALTGTQATTLLDVFTTSLKGLAPASGGGTANFLRADGAWAVPPGGGGGGTPGGSNTHVQFNDSGVFGGDAGLVFNKTTDILTVGAEIVVPLITLNNTGLHLLDTNASHDLIIAPGSDLTADRTLSIVTGDINRTLTFTANASIGGSNTGDQTITLTGDVTGSGTGSFATTIATAAVTFAKFQNLNTDSLFGRDLAGAGVGTNIAVAGGIEFTGSNSIQTSAFTGDVTKTAGGTALTIAADSVTNAKLADMAALTIKGNNTGVAANPLDLTGTQVTAMLDVFTSALNGLVPLSGGGTTNFLRADGAWAAPPGGGGGGVPGGSDTYVQFNDSGAFGGDAGLTYNKTTDALSIAGQLLGAAGSVGTPSHSFTGDPNTGIYSYGTDAIGFSTNGTFRVGISAVAIFATIPTQVANGTAAVPAFSFFLDSDTGIYCGSTNTIDFSTAGVRRGGFDATGNLEIANTGGAGHVLKQATAGGDVTSAQVATADIANSAVTLAKIANIATARILGRVTALSGVVEELTGTQATTLLDVFTSTLKGLVPLSGGGTTNFLRADGTWAVPAGGGGGTPGGSDTQVQFNDAGAFGGDAGLTFNKTTDILTVGAEISVPLITLGNTGLHLLDTNASHDLIISPGSDLTADRTLSIVTGDLNRSLTFTANASIGGTNTGDQTITLTGDVTGSGTGSFATTIANNAVTLAKMADIATARILGRVTALSGDPEALTGTQATTLLDVFTSALKGLVPLSGGGTTNFLRADGTWAVPPGGGGGGTPGGADTQVQFNDAGVFGGDAGLVFNKTTNVLTVSGEIVVPIITLNNTGLHLLDIDSSHDLIIAPGSNLTLDRTLTVVTGDVNRTLTFTADASIGGVNTGDQTITLTGDVTGSGTSSFATTIAANSVTFAKMADIATDRLIGRDTALTGDPEAITVAGGIEFTGAGGIQTSAFTGDVTKSAGGTITTIAAAAVTLAKMANIATDRLIGRDTAGTGVPEAIAVGGGIEFTGLLGIQTSAFTGDVTKTAGGTALTIANDAVTNAKLRNSAGLSVIGNSTNVAADPADIVAGLDGQVLRLSSTTLAFGAVNLASANAITGDLPYANLTPSSAISKLLGRGAAAGAGDWQEITLGTNLSMSGTTLNATGGGGGTAGGAPTQLQYNNGGNLGGIASLTFNGTLVQHALEDRWFAGGADTQPWLKIMPGGSTKELAFSSGSAATDTNLKRGGVGVLLTDNQFRATDGVVMPAGGGTPTDGLFVLPVDGLIAIDTTNHKLWFRSGGTWRGPIG